MQRNIAVIMSLYLNDNVDYVSQAINSILDQTYSDFDLYIQYDGPVKDDVDLYLSGLEDNRVRIYKRVENKLSRRRYFANRSGSYARR